VQLGGLILEQVFSEMQSWLRAGHPMVPVSINISPRQLDAGGVDTQIAALLNKYDVPANLIEIEFTESAMMSEAQGVIDQVNGIRNLGIKLNFDDFGTGYSSLSRLQEIDMQVVKIDRAFISKRGTSNQADILVRTIVLMAKGLNMEVIAEGVETEAQLEILKDMACGEAQGFLFSRPVTANAIVPMLCRKLTALLD
jgi:EAL domain-containing protein (putative c-di-GMP-specific phosphodiesterase class I)